MDAKLKGTTIFSDNSIRVKVSGCDPKNTYINYGGNNLGPIEYESGSKKNKVLVVYQANVPKEVRMNVKNLPGKKITTVVNPDDSNNYYDIYGEIYDFGEEFYEPTKNSTVDGYKFVEWNMDFNKKSSIEPPMYERGDSEVEWYKGWCLLFEGNGLLSEKDEAAILSVFEGDKPTDYNNLYIYEIEAKFEKEFDSVNFYSDENQVFKTVKSEGVFQGCNIISIPTENPTKEGFEFLGWNTEENFLKFNNRFYYSGEWIDYQTEHDIDYQEVSVYHFQNGKALIRENKSNDVYFIAVWKPIAAEIVATGRMH